MRHKKFGGGKTLGGTKTQGVGKSRFSSDWMGDDEVEVDSEETSVEDGGVIDDGWVDDVTVQTTMPDEEYDWTEVQNIPLSPPPLGVVQAAPQYREVVEEQYVDDPGGTFWGRIVGRHRPPHHHLPPRHPGGFHPPRSYGHPSGQHPGRRHPGAPVYHHPGVPLGMTHYHPQPPPIVTQRTTIQGEFDDPFCDEPELSEHWEQD